MKWFFHLFDLTWHIFKTPFLLKKILVLKIVHHFISFDGTSMFHTRYMHEFNISDTCYKVTNNVNDWESSASCKIFSRNVTSIPNPFDGSIWSDQFDPIKHFSVKYTKRYTSMLVIELEDSCSLMIPSVLKYSWTISFHSSPTSVKILKLASSHLALNCVLEQFRNQTTSLRETFFSVRRFPFLNVLISSSIKGIYAAFAISIT